MSFSSAPSIYNQSFQSDEDFVKGFVARRGVLETLCRRLKAIGSESDSQHQLIIGSRGMGKTSLLRRMAIEIDGDAQLSSHFIPLVFREEQYNVLHLRDFWQNCGEALAEWAEKNGRDELAQRIDDRICSKSWADDEGAVDQFFEEMNVLGRRAVLLIDNLDLIIDSLKPSDRWTLRGSLQMRGGPIVLGAATQSLQESSDREAAFYEFFQPTYLEPLGLPETERCMFAMAVARGSLGKRVVRTLKSEPARLKVLHRLTGGNPRVLALTYRFLETADTSDAMADLEMLLDEVTPYYKARIEEYQTPLQRATIDAIALHWDPISTGELAKEMGVPSTTLSSQLNRLRKDGMIENTETSGSYAGHQISERFLNIWYLMRHGTRRTKQRMRWLVAFLSTFYSSHDLHAIHQEARVSGSVHNWAKDYADAFEQAKRYAISLQSEQNTSTIRKGMGVPNEQTGLERAIEAAFAEVDAFMSDGQAFAGLEVVDSLIEDLQAGGAPDAEAQLARALVKRGSVISEVKGPQVAIKVYEEVVSQFDGRVENELQIQVFLALLRKAELLARGNDAAEAIEIYNQILARCEGTREEALVDLAEAASIQKGIVLRDLEDFEGAVEAFDHALKLNGEAAREAWSEQKATAQFLKAILLGDLGRYREAIEAFDAIIEEIGDSDEPEVLDHLALVLYGKGSALDSLGEVELAIEAYDDIIARFSSSTSPAIWPHLAWAMLSRSLALASVGELSASMQAVDEFLLRFGDSSEDLLQDQIAMSMLTKGLALSDNGDMATALEMFDRVIVRFGDSASASLQLHVAAAMSHKCSSLLIGEAGSERVSKALSELNLRFGNSPDQELREQVAIGMSRVTHHLLQSAGFLAAQEVYEQLVTDFGNDPSPLVREHVALAIFHTAVSFEADEDGAKKIQAYDEVISRYGSDESLRLQDLVARSLVGKGIGLGAIGRVEEEIATYDTVIAAFEGRAELEFGNTVANAMLYKGVSLAGIGDLHSAIASYEGLIRRFDASSDEGQKMCVAKATYLKGVSLRELGEADQAINCYERSMELFRELASEHARSEWVAVAIRLGNLLLDYGLDAKRAEELFLDAAESNQIAAFANLCWLYLVTGQTEQAKRVFDELGELPHMGRALIASAISISNDNFGQATEALSEALSGSLDNGGFDFGDDIERLVGLAVSRGFGEKLIAWFEKGRFSERYAPVYISLLAIVRGEARLLDANPEVREAAAQIYDRLTTQIGKQKERRL